MATVQELKEEIYRRLACHGYNVDEFCAATMTAYKAYLLVLKNKEEIDNDGRSFIINRSDIPDDLYEDALGWLNELLPYR
jgi:hypothetical protein